MSEIKMMMMMVMIVYDDDDDGGGDYWLQMRKKTVVFREVLEWCQLQYHHPVSGKTMQLTVKPFNELFVELWVILLFHL